MIKSRKVQIRAIILMLVLMIIFQPTYILGKSKVGDPGVSNFPWTYQSYIQNLQNVHPNWKFYPVNLNLEWSHAIGQEGGANMMNAVPSSLCDAWKYIPVTNKEPGWDAASDMAVMYAMDPRNFLDDQSIFQFEYTVYNASEIQNFESIEGIEAILSGTDMSNKKVSYYRADGSRENMEQTYAQLIMEAAKGANMSAYHIASRIKQETACRLNYRGIVGNNSNYPGVYNFFNIGATPKNGNDAITNGLIYAQNNGWNNPETALNEGAKYIYKQFAYYGQYTKYFEKFDVNDTEHSLSIFSWQYMTNIFAPNNESLTIAKAYKNSGIDYGSKELKFYIPVYNNISNEPVTYDKVNSSQVVNPPSPNPTNNVKYGDVDNNGTIDAKDLLQVKKHVIGATSLSGNGYKAGDVNRDNKIDAKDVLKIQRQIVGLESIPQ